MIRQTKHLQICETLRRDILDGKYPPGTPFPSVVAGVLVEPLEFLSDMDDLNRENMAKLDAEGIPVVLIDSDIEPPPRRGRYDVVGIHNQDAGIAIAEHLFAQGVRKIGFQMRPNWAPSVRNRLRGVRTACAELKGTRRWSSASRRSKVTGDVRTSHG